MKKISCLIPAFNEEKSIAHTLAVVIPLLGTHVHEIIVIDDASRDATKHIVQGFPDVLLIAHQKNEGKSKSVSDGIHSSTGDHIFLLDADLKFLHTQNILDLLAPIEQECAEVTISYRKNAWPLFPFKEIDYLSGERIFPKDCVVTLLPRMAMLPSYGLEVFLNRMIIREQLRIMVVQWPNVENDFNQYKHGWWRGTRIVLKIWWNVLSTVSIVEMYTQNIRMKKLLVR